MSSRTISEPELWQKILERLDLLVNLAAMLITSERSTTDAARALKMAGLDNRTIAGILNTSEGSVRTLTANLRVRLRKTRR